jgi:thioesterase domain-containing protein/acyl carrier protein
MAGRLGEADRDRMSRGGVHALGDEEGLALLDASLRADAASLVPIRLDRATLGPAPLFRGLARPKARRAAAVAPVQRDRAGLLDLVRSVAATVLGHASPAEIEPDRPFLELGIDSLTSVEVRNALAAATGLKLPATVAFDHSTPEALADHLLGLLDTGLSDTGPLNNGPLNNGPLNNGRLNNGGPAREESRPDDIIGTLFRQACEQRRLKEGFALLESVAALRPTFASAAEVPESPTAVRLARGGRPLTLVCFSSQVALAGVHQYARFASAFRDVRDVVALAVPGFAPGEALPATEDALLELLARTVREQVGDGPYAVLGSSSGGVLAYAAADRLTRDGHGPQGVVLLDTYVPGDDSLGQFEDQLLGGMFEREAGFARMDSARLSAMSWYFNLLGGWRPGEAASPVLLVRAGSPMPGGEDLPPERWQTGWSRADRVVDVPGNHFTMMEDLAPGTAAAVDAWLRELPAET